VDFPNLFSPVKIGALELRNRLIMSLYPTKYPTDGQVNDRYIEFWRARAGGGVAMIVLDGGCLDYPAAYKGGPELRMDTDEQAAGLKQLLAAVQSEGARAFMHLNYPAGLACEAGTPGAREKKGRWVLPLVGGATADQLAQVVKAYGAGAARAREIGYDGVEVQASWGDLVAQFLSPLSNKRTDEYGGSLENRSRLLIEIIGQIKRAAGGDFPLQIKFVTDELVSGGFGLDEAKQMAGALEAAGADSILVNVGNKKTKKQTVPPHSLPPGVSVSYAAALKSAVKIPVIAMGKINSPVLAEEILSSGRADMVAMTRALIADPDLPNKAAAGRPEDIRGCIYCLDDCADKGVSGLGRACVNNPLAGLEYEIKIEPAGQVRQVWVIGGGPAGMQAALTAAGRGHRVKLFEATSVLGGQFLLAPLAPFKAEVAEVLRWLEVQIAKSSVEVELNHHIDADEILMAKPDVVIIAVGSEPKRPPLPGVDAPNVYSVKDYLARGVKPGRDIVVIGGGDAGCELAERAADEGSRVTILEVAAEILMNTKSVPRADMLSRLGAKNVAILTAAAAAAIQPGEVLAIDKDGRQIRLPADTVVYSVGNSPVRGLYHDLQGKISEVFLVGDAEEPGNVGHALRTALRVAASLD